MSPDDEAEQALRAAYGKRLSEVFQEFFVDLSIPQLTQEAAARLFASHGSFPAYSVWRSMALHNAGIQASKQEPREFEPPNSAGHVNARAAALKAGGKATSAEWAKLVAWATPKHRRVRGDDGKWNLTEDEFREALG